MFDFGDAVKFLPWVGESYQTCSSGSKVLVIGESHYGVAPGLYCNFTREVLQKHLSDEQRLRFFTNIARAITGEANADLNQHEFWKSVAFCNYVQEPVAEARSRPTIEQGIEAQEGFEDVLNTLRPDKIIMLGNFVWDMTPSTGHEGEPICSAASTKTLRTWYHPTDVGNLIHAGKIEHPSSGRFSADAWYPVVKQFLSSK